MAKKLDRFNRRMLVKRSTVAGTVPTVPALPPAVDLLDHTKGGWLDTDLYVGELFINSADNRVWYRSASGIREITSGGGGGSENFLELHDTPSVYTGHGGEVVAVNASATELEFVAGGAGSTGPTGPTGPAGPPAVDEYKVKIWATDTVPGFLNDKLKAGTGISFAGTSPTGPEGPAIQVNNQYTTLVSNTDTPVSYSGSGGFVLAVKSTEDGVEFVRIAGGGGGITINNNSVHSVITGSDTPDTLEAQRNFSYNPDTGVMKLASSAHSLSFAANETPGYPSIFSDTRIDFFSGGAAAPHMVLHSSGSLVLDNLPATKGPADDWYIIMQNTAGELYRVTKTDFNAWLIRP